MLFGDTTGAFPTLKHSRQHGEMDEISDKSLKQFAVRVGEGVDITHHFRGLRS